MKKQSSLARLFEYAGGFKYLTILSWVLSGVSALLALMPFIYIWKIIREVLEAMPNYGEATSMAHYGWMAVLFAILSMLIYFCALMCSHIAAFRIAANIRSRAMHHIVTLPMGVIESFGSGKMRKIINESSAATETYLAHQLPDRAGAIVTPCGMLFLLFWFDWRLGLISLIPVALAFFVMVRMTGAGMKRKMEQYQNALEDMSNEAVEYVRGISVVKAFGQTLFSFKQFKSSIDNYEKWVIAYTKELRMPMMIYTTAIESVFAFLTSAALLMTGNGVTETFLLNLIFYIIFTPIISVTLRKIMFSSENVMIVEDALKRIDSIMEMRPLPEAARPLHPRDNSIEFVHATFSYGNAKQDALHDVSLAIKPGETVAFVGPSGGGKTTLASLATRFWDLKGGKVLIGGVDVRDIPKQELADTVSFVFQDSRLLKTSILENIRIARPDASREEILSALSSAQCGDIIEKLTNGIDTVIGTKGVYLSGGEQQRIAIARVMLKNSPIIILDEATAFADPDNEYKVQQAFSELSRGKTVLIIAHRLSSVVNADRIFALRDGTVAEYGSHSELLAANGLYADMWRNYQSSVKWKVERKAIRNA
jgi:ATP-binding cassette subfamily B protein